MIQQYRLTLTRSERAAIDFVGHRYAHGNDLFELLWGSDVSAIAENGGVDDEDWNSPHAITFNIPEHVAWEIDRLLQESEYRCDCFSNDLRHKLQQFCLKIV